MSTMRRYPLGQLFLAAVVLAASSCATTAASSGVGSEAAPAPLTVPHFDADDPRINTAGFVGRTTRINREVDGTTFTLMIFAVGDVVTLGAMVNGDFDGTAEWSVGERSFSVPIRRSNRGRTSVPVSGQPLEGQHGGFDAYDWVNVEVPVATWLPDGTQVRLEFRTDGLSVSLPSGDSWFATALRRLGQDRLVVRLPPLARLPVA